MGFVPVRGGRGVKPASPRFTSITSECTGPARNSSVVCELSFGRSPRAAKNSASTNPITIPDPASIIDVVVK